MEKACFVFRRGASCGVLQNREDLDRILEVFPDALYQTFADLQDAMDYLWETLGKKARVTTASASTIIGIPLRLPKPEHLVSSEQLRPCLPITIIAPAPEQSSKLEATSTQSELETTTSQDETETLLPKLQAAMTLPEAGATSTEASCSVASIYGTDKIGRYCIILDGKLQKGRLPPAESSPTAFALQTLCVALQAAKQKGLTNFTVYVGANAIDQYVNLWSRGWERNGWRTQNQEPVKYREVTQAILALKREMNVRVLLAKDNPWYLLAHRHCAK